MTAFHHVAISCKDPLVIERFYTKHFGFTRARVAVVGETQIVFIKSGALYLELFQAEGDRPAEPAKDDGPHYPGWRHIAFTVENVDSKLADMGAEAQVSFGPFDFDAFIPGWRTVWIADPEGNIIELSEGFIDQINPPALPAPE